MRRLPLVVFLSAVFAQTSCIDELKLRHENTPSATPVTVAPTAAAGDCDDKMSGVEHARAGQSFRQEGFPAKAVQEFQCAIQTGYMTTDYREDFVMSLQDIGKHPEVIEQCQLLLRDNPDNWRGHHIIVKSLIAVKRFEDALFHFESAQKLSSKPAITEWEYYDYAVILDGLGRNEEAVAAYDYYLEWAKKHDPNSQQNQAAKRRLEKLKMNR